MGLQLGLSTEKCGVGISPSALANALLNRESCTFKRDCWLRVRAVFDFLYYGSVREQLP